MKHISESMGSYYYDFHNKNTDNSGYLTLAKDLSDIIYGLFAHVDYSNPHEFDIQTKEPTFIYVVKSVLRSVYKIFNVDYILVMLHQSNITNGVAYVGIDKKSKDVEICGNHIQSIVIHVNNIIDVYNNKTFTKQMYADAILHEIKHVISAHKRNMITSNGEEILKRVSQTKRLQYNGGIDSQLLKRFVQDCKKSDSDMIVDVIRSICELITYQEISSYLENTMQEFMRYRNPNDIKHNKNDIGWYSSTYTRYVYIRKLIYIMRMTVSSNCSNEIENRLESDFVSYLRGKGDFITKFCDFANKRLEYFFQRAEKQYCISNIIDEHIVF